MASKKITNNKKLIDESCQDPFVLKAYSNLEQKLGYLVDQKDVEQIKLAFIYAEKKHRNQKRRSGEPYITHPLAVAEILVEFQVDASSVISAILHDVVEDTDGTLAEIEKLFGKTISDLVDGLTKIGKIKFRSNEERMAENFRKMVLAMAKDLRVILVKLADRLHNMRTLEVLNIEKRKRIAQETFDIYAPLANRLGIYGIKSELEDLCLKETKYEIYKEIASNVAAKKKQRESYISEVREILETELKKYGFQNVNVYGRPKHFFSIYRKMVDRQLSFRDIHDLFGFRIIVNSVKDCYEALGIVHAMWKPMPGRFKDYIAMPKANLYQSLHTTVIRPNGTPAEIQIRTLDMHNVCEFGIAAHWSYKENKRMMKASDLERFSWMRQMMELQRELKDPGEFLAAVKVDLFDEEIFVFTPKGDVKQLAKGATALDFAFAVHTDVGLCTTGVRVNGRIKPLRAVLQSGDIVEVLTSNIKRSSKDWLNFVVSSKAKNKIRSFLRTEQRDKSYKIGRDLLVYELSLQGFDLEKMIENNKAELLVKNAKESSIDDLFIAIGYGKISPKDLVNKSFPKKESLQEESANLATETLPKVTSVKKVDSGILVSGLDNILVSFSKCCNPLPGEKIVGFITRGRGVSIHCESCIRALDLDPARKIEVSWVQDEKQYGLHTVYLQVVTQDRRGILADVTVAISNCGVNINKAQVQLSDSLMGVLNFEVTLSHLNQLNKVLKAVEGVKDVVFVERKNREKKQRKKIKN